MALFCLCFIEGRISGPKRLSHKHTCRLLGLPKNVHREPGRNGCQWDKSSTFCKDKATHLFDDLLQKAVEFGSELDEFVSELAHLGADVAETLLEVHPRCLLHEEVST